jgi:hypothetical protein
MMRIFQMREPSSAIEAFVIAVGQATAARVFEEYVRAYEGDPDQLLWRELPLTQFEDPELGVLTDALELGRTAVISPDFLGRWAAIVPLGADNAGP